MKRLWLAALLTVLACGGPSGPVRVTIKTTNPDLKNREVEIVGMVMETATHFGHSYDDVAGTDITIVDGLIACDTDEGVRVTWGCTKWPDNVIRVQGDDVDHLWVLGRVAHETLHVLIHDCDHTRPEWKEVMPFVESLILK